MTLNKKTGFTLLLMILAAAGVMAQEVKVATYKNLPADPEPQANQYTLFSFAKGGTVPLKDFDSDKWDLGVKGTAIIVNGGTDRKGKGGLFVTSGVFDAIVKIPADIQWATDGPEDKTAIQGGSGNGWYEYVFTTHEIKPLANKVIFVRTAEGKFAKVEILSYYRDVEGETDSPGRYYTFRYAYQPDGSGSFK